MNTFAQHASLLEIIVSLIIFSFFLYPRFNRWPANERGILLGQPKDYINHRRYFIFSIFYLSTFALFAVALSTINTFEALHNILDKTLGGENVAVIFKELFGERSFAFCLLLVTLSLMVPAIDKVDQRWRAVLLTSARVPKESLELKGQLLQSLPFSEFSDVQLDGPKNIMQETLEKSGLINRNNGHSGEHCKELYDLLLSALYVAELCKTFDPNDLDQQNIYEIENRLKEIAVISQLVENREQVFISLKKEIEAKVDKLIEILAKNCVRIIPLEMHRYTILSGYGFNLGFNDIHKIDFFIPFLLGAILVSFATTLSIFISLQVFDILGIVAANPAMNDSVWLTTDRLYRWSLGGSLSYVIAVAFGVFFHEVIKREAEQHSLSCYFLAFVFSTLGSCVFFKIANQSFEWPFIWLSVSFGLLSYVAIQARDQDLISTREVLQESLHLSLIYGGASGILQILIRMAYRDYALLPANDMLAFFGFGFLRGTMVAFFVAYTLLDAERVQIHKSKRNYPRINYRQVVSSVFKGQPTEVLLRDLSEGGALVRMTQELDARHGDFVDLKLCCGDVKGKVVWIKKRKARIQFNSDDPNIEKLRSFINTKIKNSYCSDRRSAAVAASI